MNNSTNIELASGRDLDAMTEISRKPAETDNEFRARVKREGLNLALRDDVAKELFVRWASSRSKGAYAFAAFESADAFMAERARRLAMSKEGHE